MAVDTSVAIPLLSTGHPAHEQVNAWVSGRSLSIPSHALAETYSVLTRLPGDARLSPRDAVALIDASFPEVLPQEPARQQAIHRDLAARGIAGGAVYDGLIGTVARDHGLRLLTRDARARATYEAVGATVQLLTTAAP